MCTCTCLSHARSPLSALPPAFGPPTRFRPSRPLSALCEQPGAQQPCLPTLRDPRSPVRNAVTLEALRLHELQPTCARVVSDLFTLFPLAPRGLGSDGRFNEFTDGLLDIGRGIGRDVRHYTPHPHFDGQRADASERVI